MLPVFVTPQSLMVTVIAPILVRDPIPAEMYHPATFEKTNVADWGTYENRCSDENMCSDENRCCFLIGLWWLKSARAAKEENQQR
jgi:hypothetical protein